MKKQFHTLFEINDNASKMIEALLNQPFSDKNEYEVSYKVDLSPDVLKLMLFEIRDGYEDLVDENE